MSGHIQGKYGKTVDVFYYTMTGRQKGTWIGEENERSAKPGIEREIKGR